MTGRGGGVEQLKIAMPQASLVILAQAGIQLICMSVSALHLCYTSGIMNIIGGLVCT
jgi:hypothetical protein